MPRFPWRLRWPALPPPESEPEAIEEGYEQIDVNEESDSNYRPLEYVPPGPIEEAYQTTRVNVTEAVSTARHIYEVHLREPIDAVSPFVYDAARVAAMIAAIQSMSLFKIVVAGHRLYVRVEDYRAQRDEQLQMVRDRTLQAAHLYRMRDRIEPMLNGNQRELAGSSSPTSGSPVGQSQEAQEVALQSNFEMGESSPIRAGLDHQNEPFYAVGDSSEIWSNFSEGENDDWDRISGKDLRQEHPLALETVIPTRKPESTTEINFNTSAATNASKHSRDYSSSQESSAIQWGEETIMRPTTSRSPSQISKEIVVGSPNMVDLDTFSMFRRVHSRFRVATPEEKEHEVVMNEFRSKFQPKDSMGLPEST